MVSLKALDDFFAVVARSATVSVSAVTVLTLVALENRELPDAASEDEFENVGETFLAPNADLIVLGGCFNAGNDGCRKSPLTGALAFTGFEEIVLLPPCLGVGTSSSSFSGLAALVRMDELNPNDDILDGLSMDCADVAVLGREVE